jgi:hypothetical protein
MTKLGVVDIRGDLLAGTGHDADMRARSRRQDHNTHPLAIDRPPYPFYSATNFNGVVDFG